ncbi:flavodoxin family protein [Tannerella forsythia]|uniref:Flavodoxin family protein n=1 Tax=Tannerella forsythia TaxID=28112 RepID=A0A3P1ZB90_TANFO|nr:flavodoxin domain-containing protein [Tannerella forsythia]RRD79410.1 flavodoxin family protein [Tannerella forsythia]
MNATVLYYSHKGKTAGYAREIAMYLWSKGFNVSLCAISDFDRTKLQQTDFLFLGCWTCGWFVIGQHPHRKWTTFVRSVQDQLPEKVLFFTTYKIRTGSMFRRMQRAAGLVPSAKAMRLKSRTGKLSEQDKIILNRFTETRKQ